MISHFYSVCIPYFDRRSYNINYIASQTGADAKDPIGSIATLLHHGKNMAKMMLALSPTRVELDSQKKLIATAVKHTEEQLHKSSLLEEEAFSSQAGAPDIRRAKRRAKRTYSEAKDSTYSLLEEASSSQAANTARDSEAYSAEAEQKEFGAVAQGLELAEHKRDAEDERLDSALKEVCQ